MPWFVKKMNDQYCVCKGTKESPGPVVKCHDSKEDAIKHMQAIYVQYDKQKK
jgi:hypothetical protein